MDRKLNDHNICNIPDQNSIVYKDECVYCFDSLFSLCGLFICMKTFVGVCKNHLDLFYKKSQHQLYLNIRMEKRYKRSRDDPDISVGDKSEYQKFLKESYFTKKFDSHEFHRLYLMPDGQELIVDQSLELPETVRKSISAILTADCIAMAIERGWKTDNTTNWEDSLSPESKHCRGLTQLDNGVRVPPSGWKCENCDLTTNLWLNLTDGAILCGRRFFDGSGGNNHAIDHFHTTGFPLAVKLGTITVDRADVFSYDEDSMVIDALLPEHLAHFGIDIMRLEKTDKSVEEIEMETIKRNREQIAIMESGSERERLFGPRLTGIHNTGNSCYINSVMQAVFAIEPFLRYYADRFEAIIASDSVVINDVTEFRIQMAKLGRFLSTDRYSFKVKEPQERDGELIEEAPGITPHLFRLVIGRNHKDFSTKQQQDAFEFLIHLCGLVARDVRAHGAVANGKDGVNNPLESMVFRVEDRVFSEAEKGVKYQYRDETVLSLPIDLSDATVAEVMMDTGSGMDNNNENVARPVVTLESCLRKFISEDVILDYHVNGKNGKAYLSSRIDTFPDYLWIQLKRFTVGSDWMPLKLDVEILIPDQLDLSFMKSNGGLQPNEVEIIEEKPAPIESPKIELNIDYLNQLMGMGFPENACKKAVFYTGNSSIDEAANWLMIHIGEPDFDELPSELATGGGSSGVSQQLHDNAPNESDVEMIMTMGFSRNQALTALRNTDSLDRAADWAFNHIDQLDDLESVPVSEVAPEAGTNIGDVSSKTATDRFNYSNGEPNYSLIGMVSHMGNNAHVGHYVSHIKQSDGSWAFFNDDIVQSSAQPPKQYAYLYLYKRTG